MMMMEKRKYSEKCTLIFYHKKQTPKVVKSKDVVHNFKSLAICHNQVIALIQKP